MITRIAIATFASLVIVGGVYASWTDRYQVTTKVDTYDYEVRIDNEELKGTAAEFIVEAGCDEQTYALDNNSTIPLAVHEIMIKRDQSLAEFIYEVKLNDRLIAKLKADDNNESFSDFDTPISIDEKTDDNQIVIERTPNNDSYLSEIADEIARVEQAIEDYHSWQDECDRLKADINSIQSQIDALENSKTPTEATSQSADQVEKDTSSADNNDTQIQALNVQLGNAHSAYDAQFDHRPNQTLDSLSTELDDLQTESNRRSELLDSAAELQVEITFDFLRE